jgi:hypothetical protein
MPEGANGYRRELPNNANSGRARSAYDAESRTTQNPEWREIPNDAKSRRA